MKQTVEEAAKEYAELIVKPQEMYLSFEGVYSLKEDLFNSFSAGAEWQAKQSPWISVEDAIPNKQAKGMCQVKFVDGSIDEMAMREVDKWIYPYIKTGYVTHWRPI